MPLCRVLLRNQRFLFFLYFTDYVHPKVPCIIRNAIPSSSLNNNLLDSSNNEDGQLSLTLDDIINYVGEQIKLTVDVTPDGHGDAVRTVSYTVGDSEDTEGDEPTTSESFDSNHRGERLKKMFVKPHEQEMSLAEFRSLLRSKHAVNNNQCHEHLDYNERVIYPLAEAQTQQTKEAATQQTGLHSTQVNHPVVYYSRQNDCLRTEMSSLFSTGLFPSTFPFAEEAFGTGPPDAVNVWIGNERSVSSMHKDHYENLFYVCSGQKEFILNPPADILFLHEGEFSCGTFRPCINQSGELNNVSWTVVPEKDETHDKYATTRWIEPDMKRCLDGKYKRDKYQLLEKSNPIKVLVSQGEMLYIPSLWLHRVTQTIETVGVNYWYDMKFDNQWCYFNFVQQLRQK